MTTLDISSLEASMEALIQQQLAAYEAQLREALAATLTKAGRPRSSKRGAQARPPTARGKNAPKRSAEEIRALAERLYAAVEAAPGETMFTLAASLGVASTTLERPVHYLREAERIRSVGERSRTRYFAMVSRAAA